ncbi:MAG TPA: dienelactone hydrolase family protein [Rudaea sp.]|jgi:carboxymethylenebutenolidase|nr:dienelactone hydrolase family protein [Rudaea sp.]
MKTRKTAADFHPEALKLFDQYVHGLLPRRDFLKRAARFAAVGMTAEGLLAALSPRFAEATQVAADDAHIKTRYVEIPSPKGYGKVRGYRAQPAKLKGKLPTVLVAHENRGLNPHIEDITRRLALDNFIAFAPDALFPLGGYPGDEDKARDLFGKLDQTKTREDFLAAEDYLKHLPEGNGKVGAVGFCYGGGIANFLATRVPGLAAAVRFYGAQPSADDAAKIKSPLMLHYAEKDERITSGWPEYEKALKAAKVNYQVYIYPGVEHGFNNDTTPRYDEAAATLAWKRTIAFFNQHLRN